MRQARRAAWAIMIAGALLAAPAAQARGGGPVSSMLKPGACSTLTYQWSGFKKAAAVNFRLHHNGVYQDQASVAPVATTGSLVIPASLAVQMLPGEHYTVMGLLQDGSGRVIQPSPAAWYGYC